MKLTSTRVQPSSSTRQRDNQAELSKPRAGGEGVRGKVINVTGWTYSIRRAHFPAVRLAGTFSTRFIAALNSFGEEAVVRMCASIAEGLITKEPEGPNRSFRIQPKVYWAALMLLSMPRSQMVARDEILSRFENSP
jgi:hypothetical protein